MKRIIACSLILALALAIFTSCDIWPEDKGFTYEEYENCAIFEFSDFDGIATVELTRTVLGEGTIYYQSNLRGGDITLEYKENSYSFQPLAELSADDGIALNSSGGYVEGGNIEIKIKAHGYVRGEIIIAFTEVALKSVDRYIQLHEHTYEKSWDENGHSWSYTCGCDTPPNFAQHFDDDGDKKCDECEYVISTFESEYVMLHKYASWLLEITAEDVAEIKTTFEDIGVAPGTFKDITRTTDKTVIADIIEKYAALSMKTVPALDTYVEGGSAFTIEFTFTSGKTVSLDFNNGFLGHQYEIDQIPTLEGYDNTTRSYELISYIGTGTVYNSDNATVCTIPIDELEFVKLEGDVGVSDWIIYTVESDFGQLFFSSPTTFYISYPYSGTTDHYVLVGKSIEELISEYSA